MSLTEKEEEVKTFHWEGQTPHYCRRYAMLNKKTGLLIPAACKTWRCPACGPMRAYRLQDQIKGLIAMRDKWYLMTLTIDPKIPSGCDLDSPKDQYTKECWHRALRSLQRRVGKFSFLWIVEFHKARRKSDGRLNNPWPHLHFLIDVNVPLGMLREVWMRAGGGYEVDIRSVETEDQVVGYMCKYLKKESVYTAKQMCSRRRIWGRSRDLKNVIEMEDATKWATESDWVYIREYMFDQKDE